MTEFRRCRACGELVRVEWADGVPLRSDDVHAMFPSSGGGVWTPENHPDLDPDAGCIVLHNGCENGHDVSPVLERVAT